MRVRSAAGVWSPVALIAAVVALTMSCSSSEPPTATVEPDPAAVATIGLPERAGPRRETSGSVPHVQLDASPNPEVDAELRRRAFELPGIVDRASDRSLPGARGFAFDDDAELARRDVIAGSREFAHLHPDGSLHIWLPVELAQEVHDKKWGEFHPWVNRDGFWDGVVMLYTPVDADELEVAWQIIVEGFNFITGQDIAADDDS